MGRLGRPLSLVSLEWRTEDGSVDPLPWTRTRGWTDAGGLNAGSEAQGRAGQPGPASRGANDRSCRPGFSRHRTG